jgi:hypothetical protein
MTARYCADVWLFAGPPPMIDRDGNRPDWEYVKPWHMKQAALRLEVDVDKLPEPGGSCVCGLPAWRYIRGEKEWVCEHCQFLHKQNEIDNRHRANLGRFRGQYERA